MQALEAFKMLQTQLSKQPALAFPRSDQDYMLITKAYTPDQDYPGGLCATLAQKNENGRIQIVSHASRQLRENEKNYTKFLIEAAAAWGMDNFNEYLNSSRFTLYKDAITETNLGNTQVKTLNRLKTAMSEHDFEIKDKQKSDLPDFLKKGQKDTSIIHVSQPVMFNEAIHVDTICTSTMPETVIITIMDESRIFSVVAIIADNNTTLMVTALRDCWFEPYGYPGTIFLKQEKVQTSRLETMINNLAPLKQKVTCRSRSYTFNTEVEQQWQQNQHEISKEEFVHTINFLHRLQEQKTKDHLSNHNWGFNEITEDTPETNNDSEIEDEPEINFEPLCHRSNEQPTQQTRRKNVSLCRHKLQGRVRCRSRGGKQQSRQNKQNWLPESEADQQLGVDLLNGDTDPEWAQLQEIEEFLRLRRAVLLQQGAPDSDSEDWENPQWPAKRESITDEEDADLVFITSVLESFSKPRSSAIKNNELCHTVLPPEGAPMPANASQRQPMPSY
jgi:hypothetical protein